LSLPPGTLLKPTPATRNSPEIESVEPHVFTSPRAPRTITSLDTPLRADWSVTLITTLFMQSFVPSLKRTPWDTPTGCGRARTEADLLWSSRQSVAAGRGSPCARGISGWTVSHTAPKYSNATGCERPPQSAPDHQPAPTTAIDRPGTDLQPGGQGSSPFSVRAFSVRASAPACIRSRATASEPSACCSC